MARFAIIGETNPYIAQRDIHFNKKPRVTFSTYDTLQEANNILLEWCKSDNNLSGQWSWGLLKAKGYGNCYKDGTRSYEYDSRHYYTEEIDE